MAKIDYYVSAVKFNSDNTHISKLRVHTVNGDGSFNESKFEELTRPSVVKLIEEGKKFKTIVKKSSGSKWTLGSDLEIQSISIKYLKTTKDNSTKDNLDNLPLIP
nr:DUF3892 domain-containing protein [Acetobacter persici]